MNRLRQIVVAIQVALLVVFVLGWVWHHRSLGGLVVAGLISLPLLLPLPGLIRGRRWSFAATTLCLLPYLVIGLTESIANPAGRARATVGVALVLLQFVALSAYLRATRNAGPSPDARVLEQDGLHERNGETPLRDERGHIESVEKGT